MSEQITLLATLVAKPGMGKQLGQMLLPMATPSRAEEGCLNYDIHQSARDPDTWVVYENWRSQGDLDLHMQTTPFLDLVAQLSGVLAGDIDFHYLIMKSPYGHARPS